MNEALCHEMKYLMILVDMQKLSENFDNVMLRDPHNGAQEYSIHLKSCAVSDDSDESRNSAEGVTEFTDDATEGTAGMSQMLVSKQCRK